MNWDPPNKPVAGDDVLFNATSVMDCTMDESSASLNSFTVDTGYVGTISMGANNLNIDKTSTASFTGVEGTVDGGSGIINLRGTFDVSNASFTFTGNTSILNLNGGTQALRTNGNTLNDVHIRGTGPKLFTGNLTTADIYASVSRQITVTNTITWTLAAGATITAATSTTLTLRSDSGGTQWGMSAGAGVSATRVDVQDSNNAGSTIDALNGTNTDSGNNIGWDFGGTRILGTDREGSPGSWYTQQTPSVRRRDE